MILYRHAPAKAALLDGVVETVLSQLKVDPADPNLLTGLATTLSPAVAVRPAEPERLAE